MPVNSLARVPRDRLYSVFPGCKWKPGIVFYPRKIEKSNFCVQNYSCTQSIYSCKSRRYNENNRFHPSAPKKYPCTNYSTCCRGSLSCNCGSTTIQSSGGSGAQPDRQHHSNRQPCRVPASTFPTFPTSFSPHFPSLSSFSALFYFLSPSSYPSVFYRFLLSTTTRRRTRSPSLSSSLLSQSSTLLVKSDRKLLYLILPHSFTLSSFLCHLLHFFQLSIAPRFHLFLSSYLRFPLVSNSRYTFDFSFFSGASRISSRTCSISSLRFPLSLVRSLRTYNCLSSRLSFHSRSTSSLAVIGSFHQSPSIVSLSPGYIACLSFTRSFVSPLSRVIGTKPLPLNLSLRSFSSISPSRLLATSSLQTRVSFLLPQSLLSTVSIRYLQSKSSKATSKKVPGELASNTRKKTTRKSAALVKKPLEIVSKTTRKSAVLVKKPAETASKTKSKRKVSKGKSSPSKGKAKKTLTKPNKKKKKKYRSSEFVPAKWDTSIPQEAIEESISRVGRRITSKRIAYSGRSEEVKRNSEDTELVVSKPKRGRPRKILAIEEAELEVTESKSVQTKSRKSVPTTSTSYLSTKMADSSDDDKPLARNGRSNGSRRTSAVMDVDSPSNGKRKSRNSITQISYIDDSDSEDSVPLAKRRKSIASKQVKDESDVEDNVPLAKRPKTLTPVKNKLPADSDDSDDDVPLAKMKKPTPARATPNGNGNANGPAAKKAANGVKKEESDSDTPLAKKLATPKKAASKTPTKATTKATPKSKTTTTTKTTAKTTTKTTAAKKNGAAVKQENGNGNKKSPKAEEEEEDDDEFAWWSNPMMGDDSVKWNTLEHNGVLFPPPYQPLPKHVKLLYDGTPVNLHIDAEEVAYFFGSMLHSTHNVENPVFQKNFFNDFKTFLDKTGGATDAKGKPVDIQEFEKLDFSKIFEYTQAQNELKKSRTTEQKKADKAARDELEAPFLYCKWDGRKEKVGNFRVEPPSLFRGRGEHPKTGRVKLRVQPEQITINIGKDAKIPDPPAGHKWKAVQHDNKATWLATWQENINGSYKYVMLAANSAIKGQSDYKKFEKARELKKHIDRIRADYTRELKSEVMVDRQRATAMYLIDKFALRAGNEKDTEQEADTVGCCSLKFEHITLHEPATVIFDFLGKDSIRYYDEVVVDRQVFKNLKIFKKAPKTNGDDIFDRLTTVQLNKHLSNYMPGLTAKVFRTYNASATMSRLLQQLKVDDRPVQEKVKLYNDCNREVAILCNHKRTVGAGHEQQMEKLNDKIKGVKYKRWRMKQMILALEPKKKKSKGAKWFELDDDLDEAWIIDHQQALVEKMREDIAKKLTKENEKRQANGEKPHPDKELKERLKAADELAARFKKENKSKKVEPEGKSPSVEKLELAIQKLETQVQNLLLQAEDREGNKEVALSTSKINYIDPRLTVVFSKKFNVPIEKFFSRTLREKFNWAIKSVEDSTWEF